MAWSATTVAGQTGSGLGGNVASIAITTTVDIPSGATFAVCVAYGNNTRTITAASENSGSGSTLTVVEQEQNVLSTAVGDGLIVGVAAALIPSGTVFTVTLSGASTGRVGCVLYRTGGDASATVDVHGKASVGFKGANANVPGPALSPTIDDDWIIGVFCCTSAAADTITVVGSGSIVSDQASTTNTRRLVVVEYEPALHPAYTPTIKDATAANAYGACAAALEPATGTTVTAVPATATASAPVPVLEVAVAPPAAAATAAAAAPVPEVAVAPAAAQAQAAMPAPTISTSGGINISPPAAAASATMPAPTPGVTVSSVPAQATAAMPAPVPEIGVLAVAGAATAGATAPSVSISTTVTAPPALAGASRTSPTLVLSTTVFSVPALAVASRVAPGISGAGVIVFAVPAMAVATMPAPRIIKSHYYVLVPEASAGIVLRPDQATPASVHPNEPSVQSGVLTMEMNTPK